jgi:hypothetical protein
MYSATRRDHEVDDGTIGNTIGNTVHMIGGEHSH